MSTIPPAYVETVSGTIINLCEATYSNLTLEDVFSGLSLIKRFNGRHNERSNGVTVLQHSYAMYLYARDEMLEPEDICITALMHDAHEALVGDVINPVVMLSGEVQQRLADIQRKVFKRFCVSYTPEIYKVVKGIDKMALAVEWKSKIAKNNHVADNNRNFYNVDNVYAEVKDFWKYEEYLNKAIEIASNDLVKECCLIVYRYIAHGLINDTGA